MPADPGSETVRISTDPATSASPAAVAAATNADAVQRERGPRTTGRSGNTSGRLRGLRLRYGSTGRSVQTVGDESAARTEDPADLGQRASKFGKELQTLLAEHDVERTVGEGAATKRQPAPPCTDPLPADERRRAWRRLRRWRRYAPRYHASGNGFRDVLPRPHREVEDRTQIPGLRRETSTNGGHDQLRRDVVAAGRSLGQLELQHASIVASASRKRAAEAASQRNVAQDAEPRGYCRARRRDTVSRIRSPWATTATPTMTITRRAALDVRDLSQPHPRNHDGDRRHEVQQRCRRRNRHHPRHRVRHSTKRAPTAARRGRRPRPTHRSRLAKEPASTARTGAS